jgi:cell division protease FtsH
MARKMVCEWGMSEAFGPVAFGNHESTGSGEESASKNFSDATAVEIDSEIRSIVTTAYAEVSKLLQTNMDTLKALAAGLIADETLGSSEIDAILQPTLAHGLCVSLQETADL